MKRALFLDRDGTLIEHVPYINEPDKVKLIDAVVRKVKEFQKKGYLIVIITNQSGIARGKITPAQYEAVNERMVSLLKEEGVSIDGIYFCPSHPDEKDPRRKPEIGMLLDAARELGITLSESIMVGDKESDVEAGKNAKVKLSLRLEEFLALGDF